MIRQVNLNAIDEVLPTDRTRESFLLLYEVDNERDKDFITFLLEQGADPNLKDYSEYPLGRAVMSNKNARGYGPGCDVELIKLLLKWGADPFLIHPNAKEELGPTAWELVNADWGGTKTTEDIMKHEEVIKLFVEWMTRGSKK